MIILTDDIKDMLDIVIKNELKLIQIGFAISPDMGKVFLNDSINSFCNIYLKNRYGNVIPSFSTEYRYFILGILKNIKEEYLDFTISEILIPKFGSVNTQELISCLESLNNKNTIQNNLR